MINRVKYNRTLESLVNQDQKERTLLDGEEDNNILDKPIEDNMEDTRDQPDWLNLPDLAFNEIMMMISLRSCMQVCSSWRERITKNILENPTKKNIIRARIERVIIGPAIFPSNEDICNAKWLSMYKYL